MTHKASSVGRKNKRALPGVPEAASLAQAHNRRGIALANQNDLASAALAFEQAVSANPRYADAHNNLGNIYAAQGRLDEAVACYERALRLKPDFVMALGNLGLMLQAQGKPAQAAQRHQQAVTLSRGDATAHFNLGTALMESGALDKAEASLRRALALRPVYPEARLNLGHVLALQDKPDEAESLFCEVLAARPADAAAAYNLGNALQDQGKFDEAEASLRRALALRPNHAKTHLNLGNALKALGRIDEALASYRRAEALDPSDAKTQVNEAMALLLAGRYTEGWPRYEARWQGGALTPLATDAPLWDGAPFPGKTILLHAEQGFGDSLQFIRYAAPVKARGGRVMLLCPQPLARLLARAPGVDQVICEGEAFPTPDCHAPLMSLPLLFQTTLETIPHDSPYLSAPPEEQAAWEALVRPHAGLKVGLVWAGNARIDQPGSRAVDRRRSMRLAQFAKLADLPGISFFSLQKGPPSQEVQTPPPGLTLIDHMDRVQDFADTAGLISQLDLVIGVDTSVVHLAGALGRPTWILSRFDGCWRWLRARQDTPWYPTARLFRQPSYGDWESVMEEVRDALGQRKSGSPCS